VRTVNPTRKAGGTVGRIGRSIILAVLLSSCGATAPVQEMSDARQAIAAAKEAGAEEKAAEDLRAAEAFLDSAERNLSERAYGSARRDATLAKEKARLALEVSEGSQEKKDE
jgi:PBP1b-binding outer membrane lipoprotein LpoB